MHLAHAFGERYDSPVPLALFLLGGAAVVLVSFALVYGREVARTREDAAAPDVALPAVGRLVGELTVLALALLVLVGLFGTQEVGENLLSVLFWLVVWVVVPLVVGVVGDFTPWLNPFAAIARGADNARLRRVVLGSGNGRALPWPPRLGHWLFVALYTLVVFGELIVNAEATRPNVVAVGLIGYALLCAVGGLVFGASAWNTRAELFTVMFSTWGRLGWFRFGAAGRRGLGGGLEVPFDRSPSRLVAVLLLLVSVSFDGLLSTPQWGRLLGTLPASVQPGTAGYLGLSIGTLAAITVGMLLLFGGFAVASARAGEHSAAARGIALTGLLPSLLPIAYGYLLAHYLQYVVVNGQLLLPLLGNPIGSDAWPLHLPYPFNGDFEPNPGIMPTSAVWYVQIVVIVAAHVLAVVLAHRHLALHGADLARARRSEWPWLVAMVGYTMLSLWLLAQPLVAETSGTVAS